MMRLLLLMMVPVLMATSAQAQAIPDSTLADAYRIGEYEGEGALRVPTWPVRGTVLVMSVFGLYAYLAMIYYDWTDQLEDEIAAPNADPSAAG